MRFAKIYNLDDYRPIWESGYAQCLECTANWIATVRDGTDRSRLECPKCGQFNSVYSPMFSGTDAKR